MNESDGLWAGDINEGGRAQFDAATRKFGNNGSSEKLNFLLAQFCQQVWEGRYEGWCRAGRTDFTPL
jgi:hypothetical protein